MMGLQYFFETYRPICDRWILADNSKSAFSIIAEGSKQYSYIKDNDKYHLIWNIIHPNEDF